MSKGGAVIPEFGKRTGLLLMAVLIAAPCAWSAGPLIAQSGFGVKDAADVICFEKVRPELAAAVEMLPYQAPQADGGRVYGNIELPDPRFGNSWTSIDRDRFSTLDLNSGREARIRLSDGDALVPPLPYYPTFGRVQIGNPFCI